VIYAYRLRLPFCTLEF